MHPPKKVQRRADDISISSESLLPQSMREHHHRRSCRAIILRHKVTAQERIDLKHLEETRRHSGGRDEIGLSRIHDIAAAICQTGNVGGRPEALLNIHEISGRYARL